jgi:FAD:protein FMN transferase
VTGAPDAEPERTASAGEPEGSDPVRPLRRREFVAGLVALGLSLLGGRASAQRASAGATGLAPWDERFEAAVVVQLPEHQRRPYVAIYVEDASGGAVRTLSLWLQRLRRPWILQLRRYVRNEVMRQERDGGGDLIATVSSPTRRAGRYTVVWNGRNDAGALVDQGPYFLCIEVIRQSGSYQLIRQEFTFGTEPFSADLGSNVEIASARLEYRMRP